MQEERFVVRYTTVKNCFAHLPDSWLRKLTNKGNVIKLVHNDTEKFVSYSPKPSLNDYLCFNATFARKLNLEEGDEILVTSVRNSPSLTSVVVSPETKNDLEIVELQANKIQFTLLDQINIITKGQSIVVWVSKYSCVTLVVESIEPNFKCGRLEQFTEVHVSTKVHVKDDNVKKHGQYQISEDKFWNLFKKVQTLNNNTAETVNNNQMFLEKNQNEKNVIPRAYRVLPLPNVFVADSANKFDYLIQNPYNIFLYKVHLPECFQDERKNDVLFCKVSKLQENQPFIGPTNFLSNADTNSSSETNELVVKVYIIDSFINKLSDKEDREYFIKNMYHQSVYVSENLRDNLNINIGGKIFITEFFKPNENMNVSCVEIFPYRHSITLNGFKNFIKCHSKHEKILLNSNSVIYLQSSEKCMMKFIPEDFTYLLFDESVTKNLKIKVHEVQNEPNSFLSDSKMETVDLDSICLRVFEPIISKCEFVFQLSLRIHHILDLKYDRENILICGDVGSGKTTICKLLMKNLQEPPNFVHIHSLSCKTLKGKKVETFQKILLASILDCVYRQPSVLFLDDLESITSSSSSDEENSPDAINAARITDTLLRLATDFQDVHYFCIVATCTNINKLGRKLKAPHGAHLFRTIVKVPQLEKEDRIDILHKFLSKKLEVSELINWDECGSKTEGWTIQDLIDLGEKAVFSSYKRHVSEKTQLPVTLLNEDINLTLERYVPMSLKNVNVFKGEGYTWSDIGGLLEVKQSLIEILQWPLKYPSIFKNAPIKHQSGVLLYGMPGTGKTMLAGAIAKECGLNLISVKGPELFSKYIGASEEAVRNIFEQAHRAKPCVLFFDEFDSLAPRRGHDNTGVTDRVVNQLLTQLDGIEDREGVAVVAASSRPDLLDPALLRPGRLDKSLLCTLPSQNEREEILKALFKTQNITLGIVNIQLLASKTNGFTGADLNALLKQARLNALEEISTDFSNITGFKVNSVTVNQRDFDAALKTVHPSLSSSEKAKYDRIYTKFTSGGHVPDDILKKQRATLA